MQSGLKINDAPNYLLYQDPEQYLRRHLLPIRVVCQKCKTDLTVDFVQDVRWAELIYDDDAYQIEYDRVERLRRKSGLVFEDNLNRHYPFPSKADFGSSTFYSYCPVCTKCVSYSLDANDITPIKNFVLEQHRLKKKAETKIMYILMHFVWERAWTLLSIFAGVVVSLLLQWLI